LIFSTISTIAVTIIYILVGIVLKILKYNK